MKLTTHKKQWLEEKLILYCQLLEIEIPALILTKKEYENWKQEKRTNSNQRVGRVNYLGVCHKKDNLIVLNVKHHQNLLALDDTLRHELIHLAKPSYNHRSKTFVDKMRKLKQGKIKNGRFY